MRLKDHIIRDVVTNLRDVAIEFHAAGQLRERLRHALEPLLTQQVDRIAPAPDDAPQVVADELPELPEPHWKRNGSYSMEQMMTYAHAALAAAPVQAQEPVARVSDRFASDDGTNDEITAYLPVGTALYRAPVQPVAVPDGWKLVPAEPTDEMGVAAIKVTLGNVAINGVDQYRAMIAAAPAAPAAQCDAKGAERIVALLEAMPYEMTMENELSRRQFYSRVQEAADRLEVAEAKAIIAPAAQGDAKDADRYRWLRDGSINQWQHPLVVSQERYGDHMHYLGPLTGSSLDSSVDAAIAASKVGA